MGPGGGGDRARIISRVVSGKGGRVGEQKGDKEKSEEKNSILAAVSERERGPELLVAAWCWCW